MSDNLMAFRIGAVETAGSIGADADPGAALSRASIDGYPPGWDAPGRVVCRVWLTPSGFVTDWHEDAYRSDPAVLGLVEDAKAALAGIAGARAEAGTPVEKAVLDWMLRNTAVCPFDGRQDLDFENGCTGFGTDGCRACILGNIGGREAAVLDWMFSRLHCCPFEDGCGIDFDAECAHFGTDGCRACLLRNIEKLNKP